MKKLLTTLGLVISVLTLTACGHKDSQKAATSNSSPKASVANKAKRSSQAASATSSQSSSEKPKVASQAMKINQIIQGDYSSIVGKWQSQRGRHFEVTHNSVIDVDDANRNANLEPDPAGAGSSDSGIKNGYLWMSAHPDKVGGYYMIFVPKGVRVIYQSYNSNKAPADTSDISRDRIIVGQNTPGDVCYKA